MKKIYPMLSILTLQAPIPQNGQTYLILQQIAD